MLHFINNYRLVKMLAEKVLDTFNALQSIPERGVGRSCTLFITNSRIIVMEPKGIDLRTVAIPIIALVASLVGLFLRDLVLFVGGFLAGIASGFVLIILDFFLRNRRISKAKKLVPAEILKAGKQNFEVPYSKVSRVEIKKYEAFRRANPLFLSLPQYNWVVEFIVENERLTFIFESDLMNQFLERIHPFVSEIVETEQE